MSLTLKPKRRDRYPVAADGIELAIVAELYEAGGEERVRGDLGLEDWTDEAIDCLIANAHAEHPIDFERVKVVEGVHPGLAARAMRSGLRSRDPKIQKGTLDTYLKHEGLNGDQRDATSMAIEAMTKTMEILAGKVAHQAVTIDIEEAPPEAFEFPEPR